MTNLEFRIWNKKESTMYFSGPEIEHLGSWFDSHLPGACADKNNIEVMQSVGRKDINGKTIYPEDILKLDDGDTSVIVKVLNHDGVPAIEVIEFGYDFDYLHPCWVADHIEMEVLGNIYNNPELLEKIKD